MANDEYDPDELNERLYYDFYGAAAKLKGAWSWGGSQAEWRLRRWEDWFYDIYTDLMTLHDDDCLYAQTDESALDACWEILCTNAPHDNHVKYIVRIRHRLRPGFEWNDWPCDVTGMEDSDDESDGGAMFDMDP
ncbi:hypothetical protein Q5752_003365 [Cryptotrichosporon argae]